MRLLVFTLFLSGLVGPSHSLAIRHGPLSRLFARETTCSGGGEPGGVYIETMAYGKKKGKWRPAGAGTSCILKIDLVREVIERQIVAYTTITLIGPDPGGYCMFFNSDDCGENTAMDLLNTRYSNKIICPGVGSDMLPDWKSMKCFSHVP
ncbi:hypothetical protein P171DRAFT_434506 [Karstenula rhodostoma CBS 690.94]|uniref:Uncharacterized protein n=1 Tax=Karstenula rhodostoma CBS 690.94 TaxID=1392251 RepID=A0A9P4PBE2_9PLEO|nr:hypothetical protein P171DRAFT_434506 [Karstenula rhodostoma CBS 690.94]